MTPDDPHLIKFFYGLKQAGLPLRAKEDYDLLRKAYALGFRPQNLEALKQLCQQLWVKSSAEQEIFKAYCQEVLAGLQEEELKQQLSLQPKKSRKRKTKDVEAEALESLEQKTDQSDTVAENLADIQVGVAVPLPTTPERQSPRQKFILNDEYFPVTRAQLIHGWRFLRKLLRQGQETEPDIEATIKRICEENIAELELRPSRINQAELLLLIDQSPSMVPFYLISQRLIETASQRNFFKRLQIFYFRNTPTTALFSDPELLKKHPLDSILAQLHPTRTLVLIFSDAGAAKGGKSQSRVDLTTTFLTQIRAAVRQMAWLNPLPKERWGNTTAAIIAQLVPMFPFSLLGWRELLQSLRSQSVTQVEFSEAEPVFRGKNQAATAAIAAVLAATNQENDSDEEEAKDSIRRFIADYPEYLDFAYHATFPLALTPDLVYYLRENFALSLPWVVVADLLLSELCQPLGGQLYQMESTTRHLLLKALKVRFGEQRLHQLSDALLFYLQQGLDEPNLDKAELGEHPDWIALAYTQPNELAKQLAQKLQQIFSAQKADQVKAASLTATFAEPLAEANFQPLLKLAQGVGRQARGYEQGAQEIFDKLEPELKIEGVTIQVPGKSALKTFAFETVTVNKRGKIIQRERYQAQYFTEDLGQGITLDMVSIPGGRYLMGSPSGEGYDREKPQHWVSVPPFLMGKYPVTQAQWRAVAALPKVNRDLKPEPARFKGNDRPVEQVSWFDAVEFCERLSRKTGREYRLPSEAQWEYACRAGTTTPFYFGETITSELANYNGNQTYAEEPKGEHREKTTPVGSFPPNRFGLYDLHGNVWEWCLDDWHDNYEGAPNDGTAWMNNNDNHSQKPSDSEAVVRGGSWFDYPYGCRSAYRFNDIFGRRVLNDNIGFRVVSVAGRTH